MKKIFTAVLAALVLLCLPVFVHASEPLRYEDPRSGVALTVPEGWDLEYEEGEPMLVTFVPRKGASARMQYGSLEDLQSAPSLSAAAQLLGCDAGEVKRLTLGGTEYYRAAFTREVSMGMLTIPLPVTCWLRWDSGVVSLYAYIGSRSDGLYGQFQDMIAGADYAQPAAAAQEMVSETAAETVPAETVPETVPAETVSETVPAETAAETVPAETAAETVPAETAAETVPAETAAETVPAAPAAPAAAEEPRYAEAVKAYESGDYAGASALFSSFPDYADSGKYLRLIRIRSAGGNVKLEYGAYQKALGLTQEDRLDIDEAAKDLSFADTAQVLLSRSDVAAYYLAGHWSGGANESYLYFKPGETGVTCRIGGNLIPKPYPSFAISQGELHGYELDADVLLLKLRLTGANTLEVTACQKEDQVFTLIRK